jgi:hypothetical protein
MQQTGRFGFFLYFFFGGVCPGTLT